MQGVGIVSIELGYEVRFITHEEPKHQTTRDLSSQKTRAASLDIEDSNVGDANAHLSYTIDDVVFVVVGKRECLRGNYRVGG